MNPPAPSVVSRRPERPVEELAEQVLAGDRASLARAITLIESRRVDHRAQAGALLQRLLPHTGGAIRVGVTGVPGVGKSTSIDTLGSNLTAAGHKVAVLAVSGSGRALLGPAAQGSQLDLAGLVEFRVPLVGGRIESFVAGQFIDGFADINRFTTEWITGRA